MKNIYFKTILILSLSGMTILSQNRSETKEVQQINIGFSLSLFNDVDIRDAVVAIKMWGDELLQNMDINLTPESIIYETNEKLIAAINKHELELVSLPIIDYFNIKDRVNITPYLITTINQKPGYDFFLIVRKDREFKKLEDLRNTRINIPNSTVGNLVSMWLTTSLYKKGRSYNNFFSEVREVEKPPQAMLPVFFKQVEACVIPSGAYYTMIELNPQLKNDLIIIEKSPAFLNGIMCLNSLIDESLLGPIKKGATNIANSSSGRQIMKLFKSDGVLEFDEKYLKETKDLFDKYNKIKNFK